MPYVKNVRLFGNGKAFIATHHVFVVLEMDDGTYHLLELTNRSASSSEKSVWGVFSCILIHQASAGSLKDVLRKRKDTETSAEQWYQSEDKQTSWTRIQSVIDDYNGKTYVPGLKDCRTFADKILEVCGSDRRCND